MPPCMLCGLHKDGIARERERERARNQGVRELVEGKLARHSQERNGNEHLLNSAHIFKFNCLRSLLMGGGG